MITGVVLFLASSALFGFRSWPEWLHKVGMLHRDPHVNHVSLRALIGGPDGIHNRVLAARSSLFAAGIILFAVMVAVGGRRKNIALAATLGTLMIPIVFHPANYYAHFIFVLPMLAVELNDSKKGGALWPMKPAGGGLWIALLGMCAAQYFVAIEKDLGLHFYFSSALIVVCTAALLLVTLASDFGLARQLAPVGVPPGEAPPAPAEEPSPSAEAPAAEDPVSADAPPAEDVDPGASPPDTETTPSSGESDSSESVDAEPIAIADRPSSPD